VEFSSIHICLIDDDEIQNFINEKLIQRSVTTSQVSKYLSAKSAIDDIRIGKLKPHIILLDINMPMMNGWDFMKIVESENLLTFDGLETRVYILSSSKDPSDIDKINEYRYLHGFFHKPLTQANLQSLLESQQP
jgi:DNA-binding NarL/FixJ family response regulator